MKITELEDARLVELLLKIGYRTDFDFEDNVIKQECVELDGKNYFISTVDLGMNLNNFFGGKPLYYETMIFDEAERGIFQTRYDKKENAVRGHEKVKLQFLNNKIEFLITE